MKILLILGLFAGALAGVLLVMSIGGLFISRTHTATRSVRFNATPEQVWTLITDHPSQPAWRSGLKAVERLPDRHGHAVWGEIDKGGRQMPIEILEATPVSKYVGRIDDTGLPFGGTWTWELSGEGPTTRLRITEDGWIRPPAFRYIARLMGYSFTIKKYLREMGKELGQRVVVEP